MSDYIGQVIEILRRGHEPNPLTVNNAAAELAQLRAALEEAIRYVKAHPSEDNWDEDFLQKYGGQK